MKDLICLCYALSFLDDIPERELHQPVDLQACAVSEVRASSSYIAQQVPEYAYLLSFIDR